MFKVGDKVKKKNGDAFLNGSATAIISKIEHNMAGFEGTGTWIGLSKIELVDKKLHPHHDVIIAWLCRENVQVWSERSNEWVDIGLVNKNSLVDRFPPESEYRVKPKKSEKDLKIEELQRKMDEIKKEMDSLKENN